MDSHLRIVLNFSAQKDGGGQNVALNFLYSFVGKPHEDEYFFIVARESKIAKYLHSVFPEERILALSHNPLVRMLEEMTVARKFLSCNRIDVIYTYFGFGLFKKSIPQIMGSADSNLFFPNIDFWNQYSGVKLLVKRIIDAYRVYGLKRCDGIVFETELLERKCHELYDIKALTRTIKPSIKIENGGGVYTIRENKNCPKGLLLCGWQLNKNILLIPYVAHELKMREIPFQFVITAPLDGSDIHKKFMEIVSDLEVESYINIIGSVGKEHLQSLYSQIDVVILLSKLESFSNNIIEAWAYKRLLMVSDEPWARDICKNGAWYVDRDDAACIAESLNEAVFNKNKYNEIVNLGIEQLKGYPSIGERTKQELSFIKEVYERKN